jgi:hypothetical protein
MSLDMQRFEKLGLKSILYKQYNNQQEFQKEIAIKLRSLTFEYLKGNLHDIIEDGPLVKKFRGGLQKLGRMKEYVNKQSCEGAWATDEDLGLLSEVLGVNISIIIPEIQNEPIEWYGDANNQKPTITLYNEKCTHWDAQVCGKKKKAMGDGNCGYNAVGLCLLTLKPVSQVSPNSRFLPSNNQPFFAEKKSTYSQIKLLQTTPSSKKSSTSPTDEQQFNTAMDNLKISSPAQYNKVQKQIDDDYLVALKLFLDDLPDEQGSLKNPESRISTLRSKRNISSLQKEMKTLAEKEAGNIQPTFGA